MNRIKASAKWISVNANVNLPRFAQWNNYGVVKCENMPTVGFHKVVDRHLCVCWGPALILKALSHRVCVFYEWKDPRMVEWFREKGVLLSSPSKHGPNLHYFTSRTLLGIRRRGISGKEEKTTRQARFSVVAFGICLHWGNGGVSKAAAVHSVSVCFNTISAIDHVILRVFALQSRVLSIPIVFVNMDVRLACVFVKSQAVAAS